MDIPGTDQSLLLSDDIIAGRMDGCDIMHVQGGAAGLSYTKDPSVSINIARPDDLLGAFFCFFCGRSNFHGSIYIPA